MHFNIRLGEDRKLCCLVMVGARIDVRHEPTSPGAGSRTAAFGMAFKLIQAAEGSWRKVNAPAPGGARGGGGNVHQRKAG